MVTYVNWMGDMQGPMSKLVVLSHGVKLLREFDDGDARSSPTFARQACEFGRHRSRPSNWIDQVNTKSPGFGVMTDFGPEVDTETLRQAFE